MKRWPKFYAKKRGDRVSTPSRLGRLGEAAFFSALFLAGAGASATIVLGWAVPDWRANELFSTAHWWSWLVLLLSIAFVVVGGVGLVYTFIHWSTSSERRAAFVKRAADIELFEDETTPHRKYPAVPSDDDITNSPGTKLSFRLPIATTSNWKLLAVAATCVLWNVVVVVILVVAVRKHLAGQPDWGLTLFVVPFFLVGVWLAYQLIRRFLATTGIGPTWIEISDHPLAPGKEYDVLLSQGGHVTINTLELLLVCEEQATYRQGTDTITDSRPVCEEPIFKNERIDIQPGLPYSAECRMHVPAEAMHSFRSDFNGIQWKLVVRGDVARWPNYEREFPVVVRPHSNGSDSE